MAVDIDTLQIKIESDSSKAASGIEALANTLERLKTATKGVGLGSLSTQMKGLAEASERLAGARSAAGKIQSLASALNSVGRIPSLAAVSRQLTSLGEGMQALSNANFSSTKIKAVSGMLTGLASVPKLTGMTAVSKQLSSLASGLTALSAAPINQSKIQSIVTAMGSLSTIGKVSGLNSAINALKKLPAISAELQRMNLTLFAQQMERVSAAMRPLAREMARVAAGFAAFPIRIQRLIAENDRLFNSNRRTGQSFGFLGSTLASVMGYYYSIKRIVSIFGAWVNQSTGYVENMNLFTVAMGEGADEALKYAETVQDALGIDMSEFIRNQGVFKQITSGFGVAADKANLMSKNLTQLGYDISSFFNISIEDAMLKLQSGISGELEPLRRLGYALDVATLQQIAYENGISQSINTMTQAQKSQLRYLAIMKQSKNAIGDMSRTVQTPANALRILQQQFTQLSRAIGNLLIPILQKAIPYVQSFVSVLTEAIQKLAVLIGFKLPTIDYSDLDGMTGGATDADNALNDAAESAKKLKNTLLGIDELSIISKSETSASQNGPDLNVDLNQFNYDFLSKMESKADELKEIMKELLDIVLKIGIGLAAWKIARSIFPGMSKLRTLLGSLMIVAGITLLIDSIREILFGDGLTWKNILNGGAGGVLAGAGLGFLLAKKLGLRWASGMLFSAVVGLGLSLLVMSISSQIKDGLNIGNVLLAAVGGALAGAALGGYLAWKKSPLLMAQGAIGGLVAGVGLSLLISSVVSILKDGLNFGKGIMGLIGGALAGFGIGIAKAGGFGGAIGLVIGAGLSLVIEGFTAQIKDGPSILGGLMTILGSALAGAGIGSVVPVIGTAGGALIGLGVGIILEIIGINAAGEAAYKATEDFKIMQTILERCADASDRTSAAFDSLKSGIENLDSVAVDFGVAKQLIEEIFAINENAHASSYELQQMAMKVDILNNLGIDGLSLSISDTTGRVVEAREEVENLIASLEQEARMEAVRDLLVQSYKDQYQAMSDMTQAARDYDAASQSLKQTTDELNNAWFNPVRYAELTAARNKEREALEATKETYSNTLRLYQDLSSEIETYTGYLTDLKLEEYGVGNGTINGLEDAQSTLEQFKTNEFGLEQWESIGENIARGIASGITNSSYLVTDAVNNLADNSVSSAENRLDIHSPSKVFRDEVGLNIGLGVAEGIYDSTRKMAETVKNFTKSIRLNMNNSIDSSKIIGFGANVNSMDLSREAIESSNYGYSIENTTNSDDASNMDVINAVMAMGSMIVKAINDKESDVVLDGRSVARQIRPYSQRIEKESGGSLVH